MPKSLHDKAKADLQDIWMAETKKEANAAFDLFIETYGVKYERAVAKLAKDRDELLAFHDFPAETSRPSIGSTSGPPTRSKASLQPYVTEHEKPRAASTAKPPCPWSSG